MRKGTAAVGQRTGDSCTLDAWRLLRQAQQTNQTEIGAMAQPPEITDAASC